MDIKKKKTEECNHKNNHKNKDKEIEDINKEIEDIIELSREEKINEEEILRQSIEDKNKIIKDLEEKNKETYKQLISLKAEFENYRKRSEKEKYKKYILGKINVLENVISLYETFSHAVFSIEKIQKNNDINNDSNQTEFTHIVDGIKLLYKEFENFLKKENVKKMDCINEKFDPLHHEVVDYEYNNEKEEFVIEKVLSDGFVMYENNEEIVLKPAKVKVTKHLPKATELEVDTSNEETSSSNTENEKTEI